MTTSNHTPIATGETNAPSTINTRLADLDAAIGDRTLLSNQSVVNHLLTLTMADGAVVGTVASNTSTATVTVGAGQADSFAAGARVWYLVGGAVEYGTVDSAASATITLDSAPSAQIDAGTLIGQISASEYQAATSVHYGTGVSMTLASVIERSQRNLLNVLNYGALGNGSTNDAAAIQAAFDAAAVGDTVWFPPSGGGYAVASAVLAPYGIHIVMDAPIIYTGSGNIVTLTVGEVGVNNSNVNLKLRVTRSTLSDWTNEGSVAIKLYNQNHSTVEIVEASNHTIGLQAMGDSKGFAYNTVYLGFMYDNKYQVDLTNDDTSGVGWCNENLWIGGRFGITTNSNTAVSTYGVRITSVATTKYYNNNNVFLKPSFEMQDQTRTGGAEGVPVLVEYGNQNRFQYSRNEVNNATLIRIQNLSTENIFTTGYSTIDRSNVDDESTYPVTYTESSRNRLLETAQRLVFTSDEVHRTACYYDGSTNIHVPRCHFQNSGNSSSNNAITSIVISTDYLEVPATRGIGVFVDTHTVKRFVVRRDVESANPGRVHIRCYDSAGTVLTSAGGNHPYVKGTSARTPAYGSTFGGMYGMESDSASDFFFEVHDDVKFIDVICHGATATMYIRSFSVWALDSGSAGAWVAYEEVVPGCNVGTAAPTAAPTASTTWARGRRVYSQSPSAGGVEGWICTTAGSAGAPGTWKAFGVIAA